MLWASPRTKAHCFSKLRDDALPRPTVLPARNFRRGDRQVCNGCRDLLSAESGAMIFANSQLRTHAEGCAAVRSASARLVAVATADRTASYTTTRDMTNGDDCRYGIGRYRADVDSKLRLSARGRAIRPLGIAFTVCGAPRRPTVACQDPCGNLLIMRLTMGDGNPPAGP